MSNVSLVDGHIDESINLINAISHYRYGITHDIFSEPVLSYATMAVEALEKQIPMKPIGDLYSVPHYRCPNCKDAIVVYEGGYKFPNCPWCGQAIDWK